MIDVMRYPWSVRIPTGYNGYKKIAVKTSSADWIGSAEPIIILLSVHSAFHQGEKGALNIKTLISTIQNHTSGLITIVIAEGAHLNVSRLSCGNDMQKALAMAASDAHAFTQDFHEYLHGRRVVLWNDFVNKDPLYTQCAVDIQDLYETDQSFKDLLVSDAERTYTAARAEEFPDKQQYIRATIADLLQQCIYLLISAKKGYRFEFYAGKQYDCLYFVNSVLLPAQEQITLVNVNISFEKR